MRLGRIGVQVHALHDGASGGHGDGEGSSFRPWGQDGSRCGTRGSPTRGHDRFLDVSMGSNRVTAYGNPGSTLADGIEPGTPCMRSASDHGAAHRSLATPPGWPTHDASMP